MNAKPKVTTSLTTDRPSSTQSDVVISGPLDLDGARIIWQQLLDVAASATGKLTIDVAAVTRCDGVGMGLLSRAEFVARKAGVVVDGMVRLATRIVRTPSHGPA
jgi:ABC-type transporter Mla MlaB component